MAFEIITLLIHNKDDIEFVTEFPCFLGHPVPRFNKELHNSDQYSEGETTE